ncbi:MULTISPECIES: gamma-glutamyltransferase family protein [unclassified Pseudomonas]|uniref:gamma-glutamyltransferase family protein n=1 Tax=unclassified Pseudomonas TaxID=196821 RepID=UPI000BD6B8A3|nr:MULTISPECIES: gamma-glutamyltransferase [unclassified Pseudomonas]PVZ11471.1 gamma-glutamyltranspeptidase/glutathione hydrolase [Pseudomonas sp. URIL14HWK12:I12]PVZ22469.1 gamma-glutamyltranspeptidase/glutathione hydrolase [Pseudomonas sp. URIL14HWK12:I10]PVZ31407.1 gamma-glutamyltranspeptidase/glutathione hydrolase [Pseudomonas sp. URIL14HWK12:I11]SNZ16186.1 gamma-glutamyltranspeptidase / glutathione hydrolase [Pseudomonas sp. URIL14HWK12:I9]
MQPAHGIAVAPHALASTTALAVLRDGGNAIEAMVAAAATIAVAYPHMNGIGGDSFWLISANTATGRQVMGVEGCGSAPARLPEGYFDGMQNVPYRGPKAALTLAGTVSAWERSLEVSRTLLGGRLPLSRLLEDAIAHARDGVPVTASQHRSTQGKLPELAQVAGFAQTFLAGGAAPEVGARFRQPRLASTLEQLGRAGLADFYQGELARSMAADLSGVGSALTLEDFLQHRAQTCTPLMLQHSQGQVYNLPPPTQGLVSLLILGLMDRQPGANAHHLSAGYVHSAVEAAKQAFAIRDRHITDPRHMSVEAVHFLEAAELDALAARIDPNRAAPWGSGKGPADTVWLGVIDNQGNAVSMIQSIYHEFGSGIVLAQSGVNWQNRGASFSLAPGHINVLAPGKRPFHTLNPALAHLADGRLMAYGSMGGDGQPQNQSAVFTRVVSHGLSAQEAVSAPRWLLGRTWGQACDSLKLEGRFPDDTLAELRALGHEVEQLADYDETCGHAGCLIRYPDGSLEGGSDPRSDGAVAVA